MFKLIRDKIEELFEYIVDLFDPIHGIKRLEKKLILNKEKRLELIDSGLDNVLFSSVKEDYFGLGEVGFKNNLDNLIRSKNNKSIDILKKVFKNDDHIFFSQLIYIDSCKNDSDFLFLLDLLEKHNKPDWVFYLATNKTGTQFIEKYYLKLTKKAINYIIMQNSVQKRFEADFILKLKELHTKFKIKQNIMNFN